MAILKTEAIVLKTIPLRSSSLIVTLFSQNYGKIKGVAKGVRSERETRGALYELFTRLDIIFYEKTRSDLHILSEAFMVDSYEPMREKLEGICFASYMAELVDKLFEVHDPHGKIFDLLNISYRYLASLPGERISRIFEVKMLREIGWLPFLDQCLYCGTKAFHEGYFSPTQGALVCSGCLKEAPDALSLSQESLATLRYFVQHDFEECLRYGISRGTDDQLKQVLERFLLGRLGYPLKSREFIHSIHSAI